MADLEQVVFLHQPADFFLRAAAVPAINRGRLGGKRLLELGLQEFIVRLRRLQLRCAGWPVPRLTVPVGGEASGSGRLRSCVVAGFAAAETRLFSSAIFSAM